MKEDEPLFKICPLRMVRPSYTNEKGEVVGGQLKCTEEECAWWDDYKRGQCGLKKFFNAVGFISSALKNFVDKN